MNPENPHIVSVLPLGPFDSSFSYASSLPLTVGDIVEVPLGRRNVIGVVSDDPTNTRKELKQVSKFSTLI